MSLPLGTCPWCKAVVPAASKVCPVCARRIPHGTGPLHGIVPPVTEPPAAERCALTAWQRAVSWALLESTFPG